MIFELDQSGKVENTAVHTIIAAASPTHSYSVCILSSTKKRLQKYFRSIGKGRLFVYIVFAVLIYLALKAIHKKNNLYYLDIEYVGQTRLIKAWLIKLSNNSYDLQWRYVGKKSMAHDIAYKTYTGKLRPTKVVRYCEVLSECLKILAK